MQIRSFNTAGLNEFRIQLEEIRSGKRSSIDNTILTNDELSPPIGNNSNLEQIEFKTKKEISLYLSQILNLENNKKLYYEIGLWTWLTGFYFDLICPPDSKGAYKIKAEARYILADPKNWTRYYRHLLACPARLYCELGALADPFLESPIHIWGDFHEQLTAYQDIATNKPLIKAASVLYWDPQTTKLKRGSGSKGAGSPRRFSDIVGQFEMTYDLNAMQSENIIDLFPVEFDRWSA